MSFNNKTTIQYIENKYGIKLTYPYQKFEGDINASSSKELIDFGCSDIVPDDKHPYSGAMLHRDCFTPNSSCKGCNFFPIVQDYNKQNNVKDGIQTDTVKASRFMKML